uniref:Uncharacterized protein n=1 Tax=Alexandrium catenella TaxID=2925 RepID=A0A7S1WPV2_ALECA
MRSCMDLSEELGHGGDWRAREWYVVRKADVDLAPGNALLPSVKMGVEARQLVEGPHGLEDARMTSADHPLVKYADAFTHNFDLIAERKSSIYHLRELAKASVLAKLLLEDDELNLEDAWFEEAMRGDAGSAREIPQLWNERSRCQIRVKDGKLVDVAEGISTRRHGVYGGVQFGVEDLVGEFAAAPLFSAVTALTEEPGQYVSFSEITGGAVVAPRQPRGVDLNLDNFTLSTPTVPAAEVDGAAQACGALGSAFWSSLDAKSGSVFALEDKLWLQSLFNPNLSDRRGEGERFAPPSACPEHLSSLCLLLREEEDVRQQRKAHFLSAEFEVDSAGPLFPSTWASPFGVAREQPAAAGAAKDVRAPNAAEVARLQQALKSMAPSFDKSTEDGTRFRIYHVGRSEVRTTKDYDGEETIGAVCSRSGPVEVSKPTDVIVKATEYVEAEEGDCHFYVVMETETGNFIVTEKLRDGKVRWAANPKHLEARNSLARVTGCVECRGACATVRDIHNSEVRALLSNCDGKRYARGVFGLAQPACRKCWSALTEAQRRAAEQLGAWGAEGWDESAAEVWGREWWQLSDLQRVAAGALGASCDSWDELRRRSEAAPAAATE